MTDDITINGFTYSSDLTTIIAVDKNITSLDGMLRGVRYIGKGAFAGCGNLRVVRLPETVIRIDDFAFSDCENLIEVHFPFYIEYISPLAFTNSDIGMPFYNQNFKVIIPKDAYLKFTFMTPQFISESDYEEYGLTSDELENGDGWNDLDGLPVYVDEDELYRMAIMDYLQDEYIVEVPIKVDPEWETNDWKNIYMQVRDYVFGAYLNDTLSGNEFIQTGKHRIVNSIEESYHALIEHHIKIWLKQASEERPMLILYKAVKDAFLMGFIPSVLWDKPDDEDFYGDMLFYYLQDLYGDGFELFYLEEVQDHNDILETYYSKLQIDAEDVLGQFFLRFRQFGYPITVQSLKKIVRQSMKLMFHVGYSYGLHYRKENSHACDLELFSEEEMRGGISADFFGIFEKEYLSFMEVISCLDDIAFYSLSEEYRQQESFKDVYYLHSLPEQFLSYIQFKVLGEMIGLRHYYNNHFEKAKISVPFSFREAQKRFVETVSDKDYVSIDWVTSYKIESLEWHDQKAYIV